MKSTCYLLFEFNNCKNKPKSGSNICQFKY
jgi:hypothetical protein